MARTKYGTGPQFIRYFGPVIQALKQLQGSGRASEVVQAVAKICNVPESEQAETLKSGGLRFDNQVQFARQYLVWAGYLDGKTRGVWALTEKGSKVEAISHEMALEIFKTQAALHKRRSDVGMSGNGEPIAIEDTEALTLESSSEQKTVGLSHKESVLERLRSLTPTGFEHFCV